MKSSIPCSACGYTFTQALAENRLNQDLIRGQFTNSWDRVSKILRKYLLQESSRSLLRHLAFFTAADALAVVEKLGPAMGIELTPEGLRRLASLLGEEGKEAGLQYSYELDPRLRELLGLGPPLPESGPSFDAEEFESPEGSEEEAPPPKESLSGAALSCALLLPATEPLRSRPNSRNGFRLKARRICPSI